MEWFIKAFIRTSLLWLAAAVVLGVAIAVYPPWVVYRPAHAHLGVVGFLAMVVFGVGYQLLPRLFGHPLHSPRLAVAHLYLANSGLAGLVIGFVAQPHAMVGSRWLTGIGGGLFALGALLWVWNLWRTFDAAEARQRAQAQSGQRRLPTV